MPGKRRLTDDIHQATRLDHSAALAEITDLFREAGWSVDEQRDPDAPADLAIRRGSTAFAVELKVSSEGRADRVVPLWAQAYLQAQRVAREGQQPLAIVAAPSISDRVFRQILDFARQNAPGAAIGIIDGQGRRHFEGEGLAKLSARPKGKPEPARARRVSLFTDINQWLVKVLLAPWIPTHLTGAPQGEYRNASDLARAASVSVMSAFRLVEALRAEHHLDERAGVLRIVRRRELLERWRAWSAAQTPDEIAAVFVIPGDVHAELRAIRQQQKVDVALALFAAADALQLGFVRGVPPYIYLRALTPAAIGHLENVQVAQANERPALMIRKAPAIHSVFRGAVRTPDGLVTDVLQTWLDVSSHPARGREQADVIERQALGPLLEEE
ncbi:MAG TPA: hypothetical protein VIP11_10830 [Gemmatimonadaceae bacterium]